MKNYKIEISAISACVIIFGIAGIFALFYLPDKSTKSPSVTEFGYSAGRTAHAIAVLGDVDSFSLSPDKLLNGSLVNDAKRFTPFYVNGSETDHAEFAGKRVLIFATRGGMKAIDADSGEIYWSAEFWQQGGAIVAPVMDLEHKSIYVLTRKDIDSGRNRRLLQLDFNGKIVNSFEININPYFQKLYPQIDNINWNDLLGCRTALGLNRHVNTPYVFVGCTMFGGENGQYGKNRGSTGVVLAYKLDARGNLLSENESLVFLASVIGSTENSGFDTGIYNLGATPAISGDGSLLVTTGNGPVDFEQQNYGCSVVRLDGNTLQPMIADDGHPNSFSLSNPGFNECWHLNLEYSSSSVSISDSFPDVAAVVTKQGMLEVFSVDGMSPDRAGIISKQIGSSPTYSQPVMLDNERSIRIFAQASRNAQSVRTDELLATEASLDQIDRIDSLECYGWSRRTALTSSDSLSLLFSGPLRDDYAVAILNSSFDRELRSFFSTKLGSTSNDSHKPGHWGPYQSVANLGFSVEEASLPSNESTRIELLEDVEHFYDASDISQPGFMQEEIFIVRYLDHDRVCPEPPDSDLLALYKVRRHPIAQLGTSHAVVAYDYQVDSQSVIKAWETKLENGEQFRRTHPVIVSDAGGKNWILFAITYYADRPNESQLVALSGIDGHVLGRYKVDGQPYFSMPLVFDEKVVIATLQNGLQVFSSIPDQKGQKLQ